MITTATDKRYPGNTIAVVDVPLFAGNIDAAVEHLISVVVGPQARQNLCISSTGAHGIVYAQKDPDFKRLLHSFYLNLPDGMPGVWVGKIKGAHQIRRCYGPDFFAEAMKRTADREISHFLCGGMDGVAERLKISCREKFGNDRVVGTYCPPFKPVEEFDYRSIAEIINESGADIVWIGLSTPKQEQFAARLAPHLDVHFLVTVGAAFDFHIGEVRQAPDRIQKLGLEWLFRLVVEPRRLFKRYAEVVPSFLYYSVLDLIQFKQNGE